MKSYRDLIVWQKSYALALATYQATQSFPARENFGLTSQLRRAAISVPANIAEGYCRHSRADYLRFLAIAHGSVAELDTLYSLSRDLTYLDEKHTRQLTDLLDEIGKMLTSLRQRLQSSRSGSLIPNP